MLTLTKMFILYDRVLPPSLMAHIFEIYLAEGYKIFFGRKVDTILLILTYPNFIGVAGSGDE